MATPFNQIPQGPQGQPPQGGGQQGQPPQGAPQQPAPSPFYQENPDKPDPALERAKAIIEEAITSKNLIGDWKEEEKSEELSKLSSTVYDGYMTDLQTCDGWLQNNKEWLNLALMIRSNKVYPWVGASNVKYPLLSTAAMQFSARAYPTLVPSDNFIVKGRVVGYDPDGSRSDRAERIAKHMSYQVMYRIPNWESDMDRLLNLISIVGMAFKKTYRDDNKKSVVSKLVYPEDLIVNYGATSLKDAYRKTEILRYTNKDYTEKVRGGYFRDIGDLGLAAIPTDVPATERPSANDNQAQSASDESTPHIFLSSHTYYDLDDDGYPEPVEIIIHKETRKVVRVIARFSPDGVTYDGDKIVKIEAIEYFTDFPFLPNPDGSIYGLGFGVLLGPINEAINSLINLLVDAGVLNNMQTGFIAKGLRLQMKEEKLKPGEWRAVNATGDDLKKSIFPIPSKEPSEVLFNLMNMLVTSGNQLASVAEIFVGKMPGQNTPASTTQETVDQAMKVFTAIYKRVYRALQQEFQKIYRINRLSPDMVAEEAKVLNIVLEESDYLGEDDDIIPAADPTGASGASQLQQMAQIAQQLMPTGVINQQEFATRMIKLIGIPDPEKLIQAPPPPPPDPKLVTEQAKQQTIQQKGQIDQQAAQQDMQTKAQDAQIKQFMAQLDAQSKEMDLQFKARQAKMDQATQLQQTQLENVREQLAAVLEQHKAAQQMRQVDQLHRQKMIHSHQQHQQKLREKPKNDKG